MKKKLFILLIFLVFTLKIHAQTIYSFYVSSKVNDNNDGSLVSPFLTIDKARINIRNLFKIHPTKNFLYQKKLSHKML
jgi:hypothetical protein